MNWEDESNGKIEARTFQTTLPARNAIAAYLSRFGLESVQPADSIRARHNATSKNAFTVLFSAAANGGAYNSGHFAAYGRLLAWRSLGGLVGTPADASIEEIMSHCSNCRWCLFDSPNDWFYQVAWDIGIACANDTRREVALLAATDTD
jgi:hypothetical protein